MKLIEANNICKSIIKYSSSSIEYYEELIKEWKPKSISVQVATMLRDTNQFYLKKISEILENIKVDCKHPKKMRDKCKGVVYCMDCNSDL